MIAAAESRGFATPSASSTRSRRSSRPRWPPGRWRWQSTPERPATSARTTRRAAPAAAAGDPPRQRHRSRLEAGQDRHRLHPGLHRPGGCGRAPGDRRRRADRGSERAQPSRAAGEGRRGRARQGRVDQKPKLLLADAGYFNRPQIERLEEDGARVLRPTPTRERRRRRCDPGLTSMQCDNASKNPRPKTPTGEDSRWSNRSSPRSSHDREQDGSREEAYPPAAPNGA